MDNSLITYNNKLNIYFNSIINMNYLFEVSKCCGYSEIVSMYKEHTTLHDLYYNVVRQFQMNTLNSLWITDNINEQKLHIPNDETISLKQFILNNSNFFKPLYPLPAKVVYKVYFDDGMCHCSHNESENINNNNESCKIHK